MLYGVQGIVTYNVYMITYIQIIYSVVV